MPIKSIKKRDGRVVPFNLDKIEKAIMKSFVGSGSAKGEETAKGIAQKVIEEIDNNENIGSTPTVEEIQDTVERVLIEMGFVRTAKAYILYRAERNRVREMNSRLMKIFEDITFKDAVESDIKRENANINGDSAMGSMLKFGSESAKQFYEMFVIKPEHATAHREGEIHIHDMDFYTLTTTCCQIDLLELFKNGFSTGHGVLREPQDILSYSALCCIAIQANQNDQHGGQSVTNFDYGLAPGVKKTYYKRFRDNLARALDIYANQENTDVLVREILASVEAETSLRPQMQEDEAFNEALHKHLSALITEGTCEDAIKFTRKYALKETTRNTYQAMEALIHNLNTMNSRAGAQVPFSTINYGMDSTPEGRLVM